MRVLPDTNLYISYLLPLTRPGPIYQIMQMASARRFIPLMPEPLLDEIARVALRKPYLAARIAPTSVAALITLLRTVGERIPAQPASPVPLTRDPKDDYLLTYALAGRADYLVTGDADLLVLGQVGTLRIVSPAAFAALLATDTEGE